MDKATLDNLLRMMQSENDSDAVMGLRGMQGLLRVEGIDMGRALAYVIEHKSVLEQAAPAYIDQSAETGVAVQVSSAPAPVEISGMPQCFSPKPGSVEIVVPGQSGGEMIVLPGASAEDGNMIAQSLKDALVAAAINKSRFKLKLLDIKDSKGEITETVLQAEYERKGMVPIRIWGNKVRGETATLATVLRRAVASSMPELVAA